MNLIIDKELKGQNGEQVNAIVDSFIAGCLNYDIYDLVSKYPQFSLSDIYELVDKITSVEDYQIRGEGIYQQKHKQYNQPKVVMKNLKNI